MTEPTLNWFHVTVTTYGSWLDGDARGFRTRHHRLHVEGDYHRPPPKGRYIRRSRGSEVSLTQSAVLLSTEQRRVVGDALLESFRFHGATIVAAAMARNHGHVLVGFVDRRARHWTGLAKKNATVRLRETGYSGKLWAVRSRAEPIKSRGHQLRTLRYILKHAELKAWTWRYGDDVARQSIAVPPGTAVPGL